MVQPNSKIDICNMALDHIGQASVSDIDSPSTVEEETCARWYDHTRRSLLRDYVWNFAKRRATISRTGTPLFDWADSYQLPNDFVRFLSVKGEIEVTRETDYDIEGDQIQLNNGGAASTSLRYIYDSQTPTEWDSLFINVLALSLAYNMAYAFTLKKGVVSTVSDKLTLALPKAITVDGQERPARRVQRSKYLTKRRLGIGTDVADRFTVLD